jgi:hypothetical protein
MLGLFQESFNCSSGRGRLDQGEHEVPRNYGTRADDLSMCLGGGATTPAESPAR